MPAGEVRAEAEVVNVLNNYRDSLVVKVALHILEGCGGGFYERDKATVSSQQRVRQTDRQKATHRLRNDRKQGRKSKVSIG